MHVLVVESSRETREKLIEVLSWFSAVRAVHEAASVSDIETVGASTRIDAVIVGNLVQVRADEAVRYVHQHFADAKLIAVGTMEAGTAMHDQLLAAGAYGVIDLRMSIWKVGAVLRGLLWSQPTLDVMPARSPVPGLRVEMA